MPHILLGFLCSGAIEPVHEFKPIPMWRNSDPHKRRKKYRPEKRRAGMKKKQIEKRRARKKL
jgi:hypothetical protein